MNRLLISHVFLFIFVAMQVEAGAAGRKSVTLYHDGALIDVDIVANGPYLEIPLTGAIRANSLRIRPVAGTVIDRVEVVPGKEQPALARQRSVLDERQKVLADRLQALQTREEIFKAAAKSQSGKAPRKTKTNPEPMTTIRRGTEFAIGELEGVYATRRKTLAELETVQKKLKDLDRSAAGSERRARIWLNGKSGRFRLSYQRTDAFWTPFYDFRVQGMDRLDVLLRAQFQSPERDAVVSVVPGELATAGAELPSFGVQKSFDRVSVTTGAAEQVRVAPQPLGNLSFTFRNGATLPLAPGEAACYRDGEFMGTARFSGAAPGTVVEVVCGR